MPVYETVKLTRVVSAGIGILCAGLNAKDELQFVVISKANYV